MSSSIVTNYSANLGGGSYLAGNGLLLAMGTGLAAHNPSLSQIASSLTLITAGGVFARYGHRDGGFAIGCLLGATGMVIANAPSLLHNPPLLTTAGVGTYVAGQFIGAASKPIAQAFSQAKNALVRMTVGQPRKIMALTGFASKVPMIADAAMRRDIGFTTVLAAWCVGDIFMWRSNPTVASPQRPPNLRADANIPTSDV